MDQGEYAFDMIKVIKRRFLFALIIVLSASLLYAGDTSSNKNRGRLYVIGAGPAGADLTTPRALEIIKKADILLCSPRIPNRFALFGQHIDPSKIPFNPWEGIFGKKSSDLKKKDPVAWEKKASKQRRKVQTYITSQLDSGKTVALLDGGDATVYGPSLNYLLKGFEENIDEVVPGIGAVNAASAALKRSLTSENVQFVILTSFTDLFGEGDQPNEAIIADISRYNTNIVIYMTLRSMGTLTKIFKKYYPGDHPVAVVYFAGFKDKERVLRSTISTITGDISRIDESWMGLVIIGDAAR